jgi:predicted transposase YdaD
MAKTADIGGKRLVSLAPDAWVKWVTGQPEAVAHEVLSGEFQWLSRATDALVRAALPIQGEFLVLIELQLRYHQRMPRRLHAYAALAEEKYELPVYPVLINILRPGPETTIATAYESEFLGLRARQDYRVINLWEVEVEEVWRRPLPALAPFVPVLRGGGEVAVVRRALETIRADERLQEAEMLLAFFASFVLKKEALEQIMRWDMPMLEESWLAQELMQKGVEQGLQRGEAEILLRLLTRRFGPLNEATRGQIRNLPSAQLEALGEALLDFAGREELTAWLANIARTTPDEQDDDSAQPVS